MNIVSNCIHQTLKHNRMCGEIIQWFIILLCKSQYQTFINHLHALNNSKQCCSMKRNYKKMRRCFIYSFSTFKESMVSISFLRSKWYRYDYDKQAHKHEKAQIMTIQQWNLSFFNSFFMLQTKHFFTTEISLWRSLLRKRIKKRWYSFFYLLEISTSGLIYMTSFQQSETIQTSFFIVLCTNHTVGISIVNVVITFCFISFKQHYRTHCQSTRWHPNISFKTVFPKKTCSTPQTLSIVQLGTMTLKIFYCPLKRVFTTISQRDQSQDK